MVTFDWYEQNLAKLWVTLVLFDRRYEKTASNNRIISKSGTEIQFILFYSISSESIFSSSRPHSGAYNGQNTHNFYKKSVLTQLRSWSERDNHFPFARRSQIENTIISSAIIKLQKKKTYDEEIFSILLVKTNFLEFLALKVCWNWPTSCFRLTSGVLQSWLQSLYSCFTLFVWSKAQTRPNVASLLDPVTCWKCAKQAD